MQGGLLKTTRQGRAYIGIVEDLIGGLRKGRTVSRANCGSKLTPHGLLFSRCPSVTANTHNKLGASPMRILRTDCGPAGAFAETIPVTAVSVRGQSYRLIVAAEPQLPGG